MWAGFISAGGWCGRQERDVRNTTPFVCLNDVILLEATCLAGTPAQSCLGSPSTFLNLLGVSGFLQSRGLRKGLWSSAHSEPPVPAPPRLFRRPVFCHAGSWSWQRAPWPVVLTACISLIPSGTSPPPLHRGGLRPPTTSQPSPLPPHLGRSFPSPSSPAPFCPQCLEQCP